MLDFLAREVHMMMTEREVAAYLRCSTKKVQRLRLDGRLAYIPGRPPLIDRDDLLAYIADETRSANAAEAPTSEIVEARRLAAEKASFAAAAIRAREAWLQMKLGNVKRRPNRPSVKDGD
ncbi:helix-turn-helix domain-containing protein [Bosea sp. NPDC003192]|uniref:helix-turn-helix domain-containing protein n=1 Tax=Bosea sp. NPDC003192 TaxID=3390551 RepID=UPI003D09077C